MTDINVGAITEALNDKSDRDLQNVDNTAGADAVIEYQMPTAENGYTWYRKYKSGWVEQGGEESGTNTDKSVVFPVQMANANYKFTLGLLESSNGGTASEGWVKSRTTTGMVLHIASNASGMCWEVKGMYAQ